MCDVRYSVPYRMVSCRPLLITGLLQRCRGVQRPDVPALLRYLDAYRGLIAGGIEGACVSALNFGSDSISVQLIG
jgi:hypothetical protein